MGYQRNYGSEDDPQMVEMVEVAPLQAVRRDVAELMGLARAPKSEGRLLSQKPTADEKVDGVGEVGGADMKNPASELLRPKRKPRRPVAEILAEAEKSSKRRRRVA